MICVSESELKIILGVLRKHAPDCEARVFGSRYKWTPKEYSDLDIALVGKEKMGFRFLGNIRDAFEESDLPYRVDVLDWFALTPEFQAIIEQGYEVIYSPRMNRANTWPRVRLGDVIRTNVSFDIENLQVNLPPLPTQRAIAATLSCLDDKIELNNRINANLEAQAQAIFKSWFVDFEPFVDGEFVNSELGRIPKGWRVGSFTENVNVLGGGTPKTDNKSYWDGNIPFFTPKDIDGNYIIKTEKYITQEGLKNCNSKLYPKNTVFITACGTVGKTVLSGCDMAMSQTSYALIGKHDNSQIFVYQLTQEIVKNLKHKAIGAVFDAIVTRDFESELIVVPPNKIIKNYCTIVKPLYDNMLILTNQSRILAAIRDALLPRLMSGEIEVKEALP